MRNCLNKVRCGAIKATIMLCETIYGFRILALHIFEFRLPLSTAYAKQETKCWGHWLIGKKLNWREGSESICKTIKTNLAALFRSPIKFWSSDRIPQFKSKAKWSALTNERITGNYKVERGCLCVEEIASQKAPALPNMLYVLND